ncbi:MAG TPA: hypothetical protein VIS07_21550 [Candidatus Binatia bacterium]
MTRSLITLVVSTATLALVACSSGPGTRGPVQPAPPGPLDALRSVWGDYSGRCPDSYAYCSGDGGQAICCPLTARCCEDSRGAYCCEDDRYGRSERDDRRYRDRNDPDYDDDRRRYDSDPYRYDETNPY